MRPWLEAALSACAISDDAVDELMGRAATRDIIDKWNIRTFDPPLEVCPDESWHDRFGPHFEMFEERTIFPLYSPRGQLLGFDSRSVGRKNEVRFMLPDSYWQPVWINMPGAMEKVHQRRTVVLVEGRYDVFAMLQIVKNEVVLGSGPAHLNWRQLEFLRRWNVDTWIAFDQDPTGRKGTQDGLRDLRSRGVECRELRYGSTGDDPGTIWDRGGVPALREDFPYF